MPITEKLSHRVDTQERQSRWTIRQTFDVDGRKVRTTVAHDPYEFQAHYYVEVFSPVTLTWNRLHDEPSDLWHDRVGALHLSQMKPETKRQVNGLVRHMTRVAADLLA